MFGAVGQSRPRRVGRGDPRRARRRHQLHRHRRRLLGGRVGGDRRQGARRAVATTSCSRPSSSRRWARTATWRAARAGGSSASARTACDACSTDYIDLYQVHRPDPNVDIDETLGALERPRAPGQGPLPRQLDVARRRRSSRRSGSPSAATASGSCASSRRTRSSCGASRPTCCRRASATAWRVIPWSPLAGGWLSGKWRKGGDTVHQPPGQPHPGALRPRRAREPA